MPDYSDNQILHEVASGQDAQRRHDIDALIARAKAGDANALRRVYLLSDPDGPGGQGAATADARNYARMAGRDLAPQYQSAGFDPNAIGGYMEKGDGGGFMHSLGGVLKVAAPIAGALIPGVGMLGAGLIGAAGSAAGGAMQGDKFNLGKTLLAGGGAAMGNKLLGNGLGGGSSNLGFGSSGGGIPTGSPTGSGGSGSSGIPSGSPGGGSPGFLDRFGGVGDILQKYGPLALGAAGAVNQASQDSHANDLRNQAVGMATDDWQDRAPLRAAAKARLLAPMPGQRDLGSTYADPTDPYRPKPQPAPIGVGAP